VGLAVGFNLPNITVAVSRKATIRTLSGAGRPELGSRWVMTVTGAPEVTRVKSGAAVPCCLMCDQRQRRHGREGQHR
jgi:hypothetical protein